MGDFSINGVGASTPFSGVKGGKFNKEFKEELGFNFETKVGDSTSFSTKPAFNNEELNYMFELAGIQIPNNKTNNTDNFDDLPGLSAQDLNTAHFITNVLRAEKDLGLD